MFERLSFGDESIYAGYAQHIQRYAFALEQCVGKRVLDAGCGTGYGSDYLAAQGAMQVTALDISAEALEEAARLYRRDNLSFLRGDVEQLDSIPGLTGSIDVVVNLENLEHLHHPEKFLEGAGRILSGGGTLVVSSPNGELTERDTDGRLLNEYHVKEFTRKEFESLLLTQFAQVSLFGQWKTPEGIARFHQEKNEFAVTCEIYYSPCFRIWRALRRLFGKPCAGAPQFAAAGTSYPWDYAIHPLDRRPFPWEPDVLLAVCRK